MKVLLDSCVWGGAVKVLETAGHDVEWSGSWEQDPGDEQILARALRDERVLVTLDKDFGELTIVRRLPHSGLIRLVGFRAREQGPVCARVLERYAEELARNAIITVEPSRVRVRIVES